MCIAYFTYLNTQPPSSSCLKSIMKSIKLTVTWKIQGCMREHFVSHALQRDYSGEELEGK